MDFVGQPRPSGACSLLEVPGLTSLDVDDDESEVVIGIRPKSSPLPRRKSSVSDEDSEPEPPMCGSRRVSFADAKGLSLVQVKEFETWDIPNLPRYDFSEDEGKDTCEYFLSLLNFSFPLSTEELFIKVQDQKVVLETIELLPGTTILKGVVRVLNVSFNKAVYVRTTLDTWSSHFDLLAQYIPGSSDGLMDCFSFKLTLVPPFGEQGTRVDFCLRYETPVGTFWANNDNGNYVLFCHQGMKEQKDKTQKENLNKKSCLKPVSQNLTVENVSAVEASSQENISTVVSKQGEEVNTVKDKRISDDHSGTSEEDEQKLRAENRRNSSRRSHRKAARMARLRDYFAQRDGGVSDTERDKSPPEAKQAAQEENPVEKHWEMQSFSEANSKSEGFQFVNESLEACSKALIDVLNDTSQAHNYTSNSEPEKSENMNSADSATFTGGESATHIPDKPLHSDEELVSAELQNINVSVCEAEGRNLKQGVIYDCTNNIESEPSDSVISVMSSESLVSQANSFTFGTVVAPLYHQVFGRVGSENQNIGGWGNPVRATSKDRDLIESSFTVAPHAGSYDDRGQENVIKTQELNQECLDATVNSPPTEGEGAEDEEIHFSVTLDQSETLQHPVELIHSDQRCTSSYEVLNAISGDIETHSHTGNILNMDLVNALVPKESLYPQGEAQEDNMTCEPQSQDIAEAAQAELPEHKCPQIKSNLDATIKTQEVVTSLETTCLPHQSSFSRSECASDETEQHTSCSGKNVSGGLDEINTDNETGQTVTISTANAISREDKLLEALHDLNPIHIDNSVAKETANNYVSCCEIVDKNDFTTQETSLETQKETDNAEEQNKFKYYSHEDETKLPADNEVADEVAESMTKADHTHGDMFVQFKDELVSEKIKHCEMETAVSTQEEFIFAEPAKVQNREMTGMVEKKEKNILTDQKENKAIRLKAEDTEAVEKDKVEQLEDTCVKEREKENTDEELVQERATGEKETEYADLSEDNQSIEAEENRNTVVRKGGHVEKELEYFQAMQIETITEGDKPVEGSEVLKQEEKEHFIEMQEVSIESTNVQKEEEIETEKEMEIDLRGEDEASVKWEDQVKPREENVEDKTWNYKEEMLVEAGEEEIVDADSEGMTLEGMEDKVGCFEERQNIRQNEVEDGLSAPVNNLQGNDKEIIGEEQHAHTLTEMHFYKGEDFQSNENAANDRHDCHDSASAESDSDDEVELYMHCLRAVHAGTRASKDRNKYVDFPVSKRSSVSKTLSTAMPSISESLDEEQHLSCLQDNNEDVRDIDVQPTAAALSGGPEVDINGRDSWWKETFSCSSISKTVLYATSLVVFLVVAHHYDFLVCLALYLLSVVWLCCQGETRSVKNNNRIG